MAAIYLRHTIHGQKVACSDLEVQHDVANGWEEFDPHPPKAPVPSFLAGTVPNLPADFPGRDALVEGGLLTWDSVVGKTAEELQSIRGIGSATAKRILEVMDS